jgi:hypothetical protein
LFVSEAIGRHLWEKGWARTLFEIYYDHNYGFFPRNLDEAPQ